MLLLFYICLVLLVCDRCTLSEVAFSYFVDSYLLWAMDEQIVKMFILVVDAMRGNRLL